MRNIEKRVLLTAQEEQQIAKFLYQAGVAAGCTITFSDIIRAGLFLLLKRRKEFVRQREKAGPCR